MKKRQGATDASLVPMAERMAAFDWSATPLGPMDAWSEGLSTSARTVLDKPFPEALLWGEDFLFCAYNDAYRPFLGRRPDVLGRRFLDVWSEMRDVLEVPLEEARRGGSASFREAEFTLRRDDLPERIHVDVSFSPVRRTDGTVVAVLVFLMDVTDRVAARTELHTTVERLRLAAEASGFASYDFDVERQTSRWSNEIRSLTGHDENGPVSLARIFEQVHPEDRDTFDGFVARTLGAVGSTAQEAEFRIVRADGEVRWVRDSNQVLFDGGDGASRPARVIGTLQDITVRRRAEEALRASDRAKDEFLAILGHELRNPLAPIRTALDVLQQPAPDGAPLESLVPMMDRQLSHLTRLVDDLLSLTRINRGEVDVHRVPLRLDEVIEAAAEQTRSLLDERRHVLTVSAAAFGLNVDGDVERLTQVVANLLRNAARYMESGGRIDVALLRDGDDAVIRVRDTGYGIPPDRLDNIFAMFKQVPEHKARVEGGLGIGLALSRQFVAMHDGSIEAFSEGLGRGSEFVVRLPSSECLARQDPGTARGEEIAAAAGSSGTSVRRVLIVDDSVDAADGLSRLLELKGHVVAAAYDGPGALETFEHFDPEIVLLDLGLPEMDGFEVVRRIRATAKGATVRIVALTGWGQERDKERTRLSGFDEHLTKPIRARDILSSLDAVGR